MTFEPQSREARHGLALTRLAAGDAEAYAEIQRSIDERHRFRRAAGARAAAARRPGLASQAGTDRRARDAAEAMACPHGWRRWWPRTPQRAASPSRQRHGSNRPSPRPRRRRRRRCACWRLPRRAPRRNLHGPRATPPGAWRFTRRSAARVAAAHGGRGAARRLSDRTRAAVARWRRGDRSGPLFARSRRGTSSRADRGSRVRCRWPSASASARLAARTARG